jgi:hypothetical protein
MPGQTADLERVAGQQVTCNTAALGARRADNENGLLGFHRLVLQQNLDGHSSQEMQPLLRICISIRPPMRERFANSLLRR